MSGSVSLVTGGAGGMGLACARRFLATGDTVVLTDVDATRTDAAAAELGGDVVPITADLTEPDTAPLLANVIADVGDLGAVAHTAGLSPTMGTSERILDVNLVATVRLLDALEPLIGPSTAAVLVASQAGHLLGGDDEAIAALLDDPTAVGFLDATAAAGIGDPGAAYAWSKWAVRRLAVRRAPTWGSKGARIVSLSPGIIDTAMGRQELEAQPFMATMIDRTPLERMGTADEIATVVEFLCSPGASFVTGVDLLVDGGSTQQLVLGRSPT